MLESLNLSKAFKHTKKWLEVGFRLWLHDILSIQRVMTICVEVQGHESGGVNGLIGLFGACDVQAYRVISLLRG